MENSNIVSVFEMMDSSGRGCISFVQYKEGQWDLHQVGHSVTFSSSECFPSLHFFLLLTFAALKNLGLCTADEVLHDDGHLITLDKFRDEV